jgi:hypothetical protein
MSEKEQVLEDLCMYAAHGTRYEDMEKAYNAGIEAERKSNNVWQSMDTAPKDKQILVWDKLNECFYTVHWNKNKNLWFVGVFEYISDESRLLWQALPDKPSLFSSTLALVFKAHNLTGKWF